MARIRTLLIGGAVGAAAAYFFDPELGEARRAWLLHQVGATARQGWRELERAAGQLQDRALAAVPQLEAGPPADDDLSLLSRVESVLLALPDFPRGSVDAEVVAGQLVLRGEVVTEEQEREIVEAASHVRGIAAVESQLHVRE
jgi:osmotically-inducible protein OsmY